MTLGRPPAFSGGFFGGLYRLVGQFAAAWEESPPHPLGLLRVIGNVWPIHACLFNNCMTLIKHPIKPTVLTALKILFPWILLACPLPLFS